MVYGDAGVVSTWQAVGGNPTDSLYQLFYDAPDAIILYHPDNTFLDVNPAACRLVGYNREEMLRMKISDFLRPTERRRLEAVKDERRQGSDRLVDWQVLRKDGTLITIEAKTRFLDEQQLWVSFIRDISDRQALERQVMEAAGNEQRLLARAELLEEQRQNLLALNRAKDEFIMVASHQLRTPATAVKQYIGMALDGYFGELTDELRLSLRSAYSSNERQLNIVNGLILTAKIESGQLAPHYRRQNLVACLQEIAGELAPLFAAKQQPVTYRTPRSCLAEFDPEHLKIALEHIIRNASNYSPAGKPVRIGLRKTGRFIEIDVTDRGVGIAKKDHTHLFQKFMRIPNPLSNAVDGNGLGLYLAQQIISMHGGELSVRSKAGRGSTFTVRIPARQPAHSG